MVLLAVALFEVTNGVRSSSFLCMVVILEVLDFGHMFRRPASTDVPATAIDWETAGGCSVALTHFLGYALSLFLVCLPFPRLFSLHGWVLDPGHTRLRLPRSSCIYHTSMQ